MNEMKLASAIAKIEGKKSQARIGDIREIIKIIQIMIKEEVIAFDETGKAEIAEVLFKKSRAALRIRSEKKEQELAEILEEAKSAVIRMRNKIRKKK